MLFVMRIKQLIVTGLFGIFNHRIQMNMDEKITIIHGPNGFGKTTILRMLNGVMTGRTWEIRNVPFQLFTIEFADGRSLQIIRSIDPKGKRSFGINLDLKLYRDGNELASTRIRPLSREELNFPLGVIEEIVPELVRQGAQTWRNIETNEALGLDEVLERYEHMLPQFRPEERMEKDQDWLQELRHEIGIQFIQSQRLTRIGRRPRQPHSGDRSYPAVTLYSEELAREIQRTLAEYGALSQRLDRTFPMRLVKGMPTKQTSLLAGEKLTEKLLLLEERRSKLREVGLLEKEDEIFEYPEAMQELTQQVLPVYVQDTEEKLAVFNRLAARIETLKEIVNSRFMFKRLDITKEEGFHFTGLDGQVLKLPQLSSGEQHMLVLLSELLFAVNPNSLVLIDEPEISLHVGWQHEFLKDIDRVASLSTFDILIATHSPQIINNRWDLTVDLKPPAEAKVEVL
jgi:ABC-type transport system involved in cytochrome c biogenesis ATPase subunit